MTDVIESLDHLLRPAGVGMTLEDIGDYTFGGSMADPSRLGHVLRAGVVLKQAGTLPLTTPLPPELGFFLAGWASEHSVLHDPEANRQLDLVAERIEQIEARYNIPADRPRSGKEPPELIAADLEFDVTSDRLQADWLCRYRLDDMAELLLTDHEAFGARYETGRRAFAELMGRGDILDDG
ncbi:MAG: hypothetical protein HQL33_09615 [Alphaproteobacteria bacterium]|nr:hypothetical protein [Alphaproteobacteria bacterium]